MSDKNLTVFVDSVGRTILGEEVNSNDTSVVVKNPAIIHVVPNQQTGQISVQLLPFFFKEFSKSDTSGESTATWSFNKNNITLSDGIELDDKLVAQYSNMYSPIVTPEPTVITPGSDAATSNSGDTKVVKLFDD